MTTSRDFDVLRDPSRREHFVYRVYDVAGDLLYVGCTARLEERFRTHRGQSDWFPMLARVRLSGPYNYDTARELEREALQTERPLYAFGPERRTIVAIHHRVYSRRADYLRSRGVDWEAAHRAASAHVAELIGYPGNRSPFRITDLTVPNARRADLEDAASYYRRSA